MVAEHPEHNEILRQWLCWRLEERDGKPTKVPYSPLTGTKAQQHRPRDLG